jgi:hypothetical protein
LLVRSQIAGNITRLDMNDARRSGKSPLQSILEPRAGDRGARARRSVPASSGRSALHRSRGSSLELPSRLPPSAVCVGVSRSRHAVPFGRRKLLEGRGARSRRHLDAMFPCRARRAA